jgi:4'-phosphopantetheinyl transferase
MDWQTTALLLSDGMKPFAALRRLTHNPPGYVGSQPNGRLGRSGLYCEDMPALAATGTTTGAEGAPALRRDIPGSLGAPKLLGKYPALMDTDQAVHMDQLEHEVHVWLVVPDVIQEPAKLRACRSVLCESELAQYRRLYFPDDQHRYLISHALVRYVLSRYLAIPPAGWTFRYSRHGKPEIANPGLPALQFNLTHTDGLSACAVTHSDPCGIDAERIVTRHRPIDVARRMFSRVEHDQLVQLGGRDQLEYFFSRWTLREAYVKARGIGISFPTRKLQFDVDTEGQVSIAFEPELQEQADRWQFALLTPTPEHCGAVALHRSRNLDKRIVVRDFSV